MRTQTIVVSRLMAPFIIALALFVTPLYVHAQTSVSSSGDISATIRDALLSDPRSQELSSEQISTLVYALMQQATAQGMTEHDILWRPALAHTAAVDAAAGDGCGSIPAALCSFNRMLRFNGSDTTIPALLGVLLVLILAVIGGYIELQHRNRLRVQA